MCQDNLAGQYRMVIGHISVVIPDPMLQLYLETLLEVFNRDVHSFGIDYPENFRRFFFGHRGVLKL